MEREFVKMLTAALNDPAKSEAERAANERGKEDTVKLNRLEFREVFGKMAGIESSNTNRDHTEIKIGRLHVLENILGHDKFGDLMSTIGMLCEEYLFGRPGGEPSLYRITEDNVTKKDSE